MDNISLVILVGGLGSRIKLLEKNTPKPLIKFKNKPFLDIILNFYSKFNFKEIFLLAGYKSYVFKKRYHNKTKNLIPIKVIVEKKKLGSGGALLQLKKKIKNNFVLINGDTYFEVNIIDLIKKIDKKKIANICLVKNTNYLSNKKLSNLFLDKKNNLIFKNKSKWMSSGVLYFKKEIFKHFPNKKQFSLEDVLIPKLIEKKLIAATKNTGFFIDIGTTKNYKFAKKNLHNILKKPAIFFDRDGVINYDNGYTYKIKDFKFKPNVIKALKIIQRRGYYIFLVTNQAGIAKGKFTIKEFFNLQMYIKKHLSKKNIFINDLRYCPYHPDAIIKKFKKNSQYRKPGNLMIESIFKNWYVDRNKSLMIGDMIKDKKAANKSKIRFFYAENNLYNQLKKII